MKIYTPKIYIKQLFIIIIIIKNEYNNLKT